MERVDLMGEYLQIKKYIGVLRDISKEFWLMFSIGMLLTFIPYFIIIEKPYKSYIDIFFYIVISFVFLFSLQFSSQTEGNPPQPYVTHSMFVGVMMGVVLFIVKFHVDLVGSISDIKVSITCIEKDLSKLSESVDNLLQIIGNLTG